MKTKKKNLEVKNNNLILNIIEGNAFYIVVNNHGDIIYTYHENLNECAELKLFYIHNKYHIKNIYYLASEDHSGINFLTNMFITEYIKASMNAHVIIMGIDDVDEILFTCSVMNQSKFEILQLAFTEDIYNGFIEKSIKSAENKINIWKENNPNCDPFIFQVYTTLYYAITMLANAFGDSWMPQMNDRTIESYVENVPVPSDFSYKSHESEKYMKRVIHDPSLANTMMMSMSLLAGYQKI